MTSMSEWISTRDRLPEVIEDIWDRNVKNAVLIYTPVDNMIRVAWYVRFGWIIPTSRTGWQHMTYRVSHWMPLPKEEE